MSNLVSLDNTAQRYYKRASNASYSGKLPEAIFNYKQAINYDRGNKKYFIDLISVLNQIGFFAETLSYATEALSFDNLDLQDKCAIYFFMGEACYCLGLNQASKRYIDLCVELDNNSLYFKDAMLYKNELDNYFNSGLSGPNDTAPNFFIDANSLILPSVLSTDIFANDTDPNGELSYAAAENTLKNSPENIGAILLGYSAAIKLDNSFSKRKYRGLIKNIKDCSDLDIQMLCNFFTYNIDDAFAKEVFATLYKENTFSVEVGYALSVAFYNNGELTAAKELLKRTSMLEGGEFLSSYLLDAIKRDNPPKRFPYIYAPYNEQMDILCSKMYALLEKSHKTENEYRVLESILYTVVRYIDNASLSNLMLHIDASNKNIQDIIKRLLYKSSIEPSKKIMLALLLHEMIPTCSTGINIMGDIVDLKELASFFKMRNFNVPAELELRYGRNTVADAYHIIASSGILNMDATDEEFSFAADYLLTSETVTPNLMQLAAKYGLDLNFATELSKIIDEKRIMKQDEIN